MTEIAPPAAPLRLVPGAPPPATPSKAQRKKRKTGAKSKTPGSPAEGSITLPDAPSPPPADGTPNETDVREETAPHELAPASEAPTHDDSNPKSSPIVELVQKRMRPLGKKISRISSYTATDHEKLNDDQKRSLKNLPHLEAAYKELEDVRKSIETLEVELSRDQASKRAEADRTLSLKVQEAVSSSQASYFSRFSSILTLLRLRSVLASGDVPPVVLDFDESEGAAIFTACDTLLGEENDTKHAILSGLLSGEGDVNGVSFTRLFSIVQSFLDSPREPSPLPTEPEHVQTEVVPEDEPVSGIPSSLSVPSSLRFMQASELEAPAIENDAEWVEKPDVEPNGASEEHVQVAEDLSVEQVEATSSHPIDWAEADEEAGLPSIANLQASFAPSGSATPVVQTIEVNLPSSAPHLNGDDHAPPPQSENDGFTPASRGGRGRGRGHRGERGNMRGGFRGDRTGFHRGGERSGRGNRGGDRGHRGGRADGEWRNGDGEHRGRGHGRGRGRGRGGDGGERRGSGQHESRGGPPS